MVKVTKISLYYIPLHNLILMLMQVLVLQLGDFIFITRLAKNNKFSK